MPLTAQRCHKICVLRAVSSNDNAHSSSGYYMLTGQPHQPMNSENANPGPPNDYPVMGGILRKLRGGDDAFEVRRILKAFVDAQWLDTFQQRLADYRAHLKAELTDENGATP